MEDVLKSAPWRHKFLVCSGSLKSSATLPIIASCCIHVFLLAIPVTSCSKEPNIDWPQSETLESSPESGARAPGLQQHANFKTLNFTRAGKLDLSTHTLDY